LAQTVAKTAYIRASLLQGVNASSKPKPLLLRDLKRPCVFGGSALTRTTVILALVVPLLA
jgi:hypothetical protein